jgi:hypothetical protein
MRMEGTYVTSRLVDGLVRVVVWAFPLGPEWAIPGEPGTEAQATEENKRRVAASTVDDWSPHYTVERPGQPAKRGLLAPCTSVLRPKQFSGLSTVSVLTIDPADPSSGNPACVLGGANNVYASRDNIYLATTKWQNAEASPVTEPPAVPTEIHQFAIPAREKARYLATGTVPGMLLNQFSMSEHDGRLRVASTNGPASEVNVLERRNGVLVPVGHVGDLGKGQVIRAVRFIGTRGYVVTFRRTDPLYVLDLADPRRPKVTGELEIPGYSAYLHPISDTLLIGVGQAADEQGRVQGTQLSLFDVADPAHPVRRAQTWFDHAWSEAENDHHAFLWWPATRMVVVPLRSYGQEGQFNGAVALELDPATGFGPATPLSHEGRVAGQDTGVPVIRRSLVVGQWLLTLSDRGLLASDLDSLGDRSWLEFTGPGYSGSYMID